MNTFLGELATFNDIQYAKYRVAFKLRKLQKTFLFDEVDMSTLQEGLHLSGVESLPRTSVIPTSQLITAMQELYSSVRQHKPMLGSAQVQQARELCTNWLQMNYQCASGGKIQVGSLKIILCLLTAAKESDKARHIFSILANSNGSVECTDMAYFCNVTQKLAGTLQEDLIKNWDGSERLWCECLRCVRTADDIADEDDCGGIRRQWLSQFEFIKAFTTQPGPLFLSWWNLFHRVKDLGRIVHNVRCSACTRKPIVSFRYQCMECSNFNLCQMCFLKGRVAGAHSDNHRMVEVTAPTKSQKSWKHRLLGASGPEGRIWDEPKSPFVFSPRSSVSSFGSSGDHTDTSMNAIADMLASSQQQQKSTMNRHTHKPTMIRVGSQPIIRNNPIITTPHQQTVPLPSHHQLKQGSLSTNSSGSPDSLSSLGGKFNYEGSGQGNHSHSASTSSSNDATSVGMAANDPTMALIGASKTRSQSAVSPPYVQDELAEINRRLSMEVDLLLNDIASSTEELPSPPSAAAAVNPSLPPVKHHPPVKRGYSLQHLRLEEKALEKNVSALANKRDELTEELDTLITQVKSLHTRSVSLSNGVRVTPTIGVSPLVDPTHSRSDSLPAEAYLGSQSPLGQYSNPSNQYQIPSGQSPTSSPIPRLSPAPSQTSVSGLRNFPLVHRKISPSHQLTPVGINQQPNSAHFGRTSPVCPPVHHHLAPRGLYNSLEQINEKQAHNDEYHRPLSASYQRQPHQFMITEL